jgi:hypothetical protein
MEAANLSKSPRCPRPSQPEGWSLTNSEALPRETPSDPVLPGVVLPSAAHGLWLRKPGL